MRHRVTWLWLFACLLFAACSTRKHPTVWTDEKAAISAFEEKRYFGDVVFASNGKPVAEGKMQVFVEELSGPLNQPYTRRIIFDFQGQAHFDFTADIQPNSQYHIVVDIPGHPSISLRGINLPAGSMRIEIPAGDAWVIARITDTDGFPIADSPISLVRKGPFPGSSYDIRSHSGEIAALRYFGPIDPGEYELRAYPAWGASEYFSTPVVAAPQGKVEFAELKLERKSLLDLRIQESRGQPPPRFDLDTDWDGKIENAQRFLHNNILRLFDIPPGEHQISVIVPGKEFGIVHIPAQFDPSIPFDLKAHPASGSIGGSFDTSAFKVTYPLQLALSYEGPLSQPKFLRPVGYPLILKGDRFFAGGLPPGEYRVWQPTNYPNVQLDNDHFTLTEGQSIEEFAIRAVPQLKESIHLSGRIVRPDNQPVDGLTLRLYSIQPHGMIIAKTSLDGTWEQDFPVFSASMVPSKLKMDLDVLAGYGDFNNDRMLDKTKLDFTNTSFRNFTSRDLTLYEHIPLTLIAICDDPATATLGSTIHPYFHLIGPDGNPIGLAQGYPLDMVNPGPLLTMSYSAAPRGVNLGLKIGTFSDPNQFAGLDLIGEPVWYRGKQEVARGHFALPEEGDEPFFLVIHFRT